MLLNESPAPNPAEILTPMMPFGRELYWKLNNTDNHYSGLLLYQNSHTLPRDIPGTTNVHAQGPEKRITHTSS